MGQENLLSTFRALLILAGSFLVGHNLFGHPIDSKTWQVVSGALVTIIATVWGIASKTATIESVESAVRSVITAIGGLLASAGIVTGSNVNAALGFVTALAPALQSYLGKTKGQQIAAGALTTSVLTGKASLALPKAPAFYAGTKPPEPPKTQS
jgi:hypothetical protein